MADIIQIRRDTAANWTSVNPVLASGEPGFEIDTQKLKVGDGVTAWSSLSYYDFGALDIIKPNSYQETIVDDSTATGVQPLDCAAGNGFTWALTGNITDISFSNVPAAGTMYSCTIVITQNASTAYTVTYPASVKWNAATPHTMTATLSAVDVVTLTTVDGGTTWYGFVGGQDMS